MNATHPNDSPLTFRRALKTWLPLAGSWLMMSIEMPLVTAVVARLQNPEINLAAYGGVVFPIALTIEAPVMMLLAASTALSRDWASYRKLRSFTLILGLGLSCLHILVALTPIYDFIVRVLLQSPPEVIEPARLGLIFLAPWSISIAFRRFQQGAMIRHGHAEMVSQITLVRLVTSSVVLTIAFLVKTIPGTIVAGLAQASGVSAEALFAAIRIRKVFPNIKSAPAARQALTLKRLIKFYAPLAFTSSLWLLWQPIISAAISRMPNALESLAVWSVTSGLLLVFRSPGVAMNEAIVALLEEKQAFRMLRRFSWVISGSIFAIALIFVLTPLSRLWLANIANLIPDKVAMGRMTLMLALPLGFLSVWISFYQGIIVQKEKTIAVAEAVVAFLVALVGILLTGVITQSVGGVFVASFAFTIAHLVQGLWLMLRSRGHRRQFNQSESVPAAD